MPLTKRQKEILDHILETVRSMSGDITPNWSKSLPDEQRFVVLEAFDNQAFLDRETGLVWETPVGIPRT